MKKIAYFSFGHVDVTLPLVKYLFNKKVDIEFVFVFQSSRPGESVFNFQNSVNTIGFLSNEEIKNQIPNFIKDYLGEAINCIKIFMFPTFKLLSSSSFKCNLIISKYSKAKDIIHISGAGLFIWDLWISRFKKLIVTIHDYAPHKGENSKYEIAEFLEKRRVKYSDHLIVQNQVDYLNLTLKKKNISYIPFATLDFLNGCSNKKIDKKFSFIFFGRISEYKGLELLLESFKTVLKKHPSVNLCIAGSGYSKTLDEFKKIKNVTVINEYLKTEILVDLITSSKIAVCPYLEGTQSGVAMTAFSLQVPIIASEIDSFKEVIINRKNGLLFTPGNSKELAESMIIVIENDELLKKMKSQIQDTLMELGFNWNTISQSLISIYQKN